MKLSAVTLFLCLLWPLCSVGSRADCKSAWDTDHCAHTHCQNGATCIHQKHGFRCQCAPGYAGFTCHIDINDCAPDPCQNGATCVDEVNGFTCQCQAGYTGRTCDTAMPVRLVGGSSPREGRVEVWHNGQWGTVCDDYWDSVDATVVCSQLGYNLQSAIADGDAQFGEGTGPIFLDEVSCTGSESSIFECPAKAVGDHDCDHSEDAGVRCESVSVRLVGGFWPMEGRVEVWHNGEWGTVCDNDWDDVDAAVVCRQLGYASTGATAWTQAEYGPGTGPIFLDSVRCTGNESSIFECPANAVGDNNCGHDEDAGVYCE